METNGYKSAIIRKKFSATGLSETECAQKAGVDRKTLARALAGENITTLKLKLVCASLNLTMRQVVDGSLAVLNGHGKGSRERRL